MKLWDRAKIAVKGTQKSKCERLGMLTVYTLLVGRNEKYVLEDQGAG